MSYRFLISTSKKERFLFSASFSRRGLEELDFRLASRRIILENSLPPLVRRLKRELIRYFQSGGSSFSRIPLDMSKSPHFYRTVWRRAQRIPRGQVVTYETLARMSGSRNAARAVGSAMRCNPFPILIPCHRVVRKDGTLGGYSKGLKLKKLLLSLEGRVL